jgi:hypothetical protein
VDQLASDPTSVDVGALARERFPDGQQNTRQALIGAAETAIAQVGNTTAGYGPGFWQTFNRVTAADSDPNKINDPAELLKLAGPEAGGALTMPGVQQLLRFVAANGTVEGRAQNAMEQMFLRQAHAAVTGSDGEADPTGQAWFQNFFGAYFPALEDGLRSGKSAMQLLSAAGSDYLGKLVPAFTPPSAQPADQPAQNAPAAQATAAVDLRAAPPWADGVAYGGGPPQPQPAYAAPPEPVAESGFIDKVGRVLQAAGAGATEGYGSGPVGFSQELMNEPWAKAIFGSPGARNIVQTLNKIGIEGTYELGQAVLRTASAIYVGGVNAGAQSLVEAGVNSDDAGRLARDFKGMPEAFMGMAGTLRAPTLSLPKFDGKTSGILFTNEGRIIELKSGTPDPAYSIYPAAKHVEGKAAIWIRENGSSGGVVFHNNPNGTCRGCNSNIPTLLPEGATLYALPEAGTMARRSWTDIRKPYIGNSAQPLTPE